MGVITARDHNLIAAFAGSMEFCNNDRTHTMAQFANDVLVFLKDPAILVMLGVAITLFVIGCMGCRHGEREFAKRLAGADWRVKYGGRMLLLMPFPFPGCLTIVSRCRALLFAWPNRAWPLAIKEVGHITAWRCQVAPFGGEIVAARKRYAGYPRVLIIRPWWGSRFERTVLSRLYPLDPGLAERLPRLRDRWRIIVPGNPEHAARFLSAVDELNPNRGLIGCIELKDEYIVVTSYESLDSDSALSFERQANRILMAAGLPDLFEGVLQEPDEDMPENGSGVKGDS